LAAATIVATKSLRGLADAWLRLGGRADLANMPGGRCYVQPKGKSAPPVSQAGSELPAAQSATGRGLQKPSNLRVTTMTITNPMFPPPLVPAAYPTSRRSILFGLAAGVVASPAVASSLRPAVAAPAAETALSGLASAAAPPSPDAGLLQLFDQYTAAWSEFGRLIRLQDRMEEKHRVRIPMPEEMFVRPGDAELGLPAVSEYSPYNSSYWLSIRYLQKPEWPVISAIEPPPGTKLRYLPDGETIYFAPPSEAACARCRDH
jgi:hypothetical protein